MDNTSGPVNEESVRVSILSLDVICAIYIFEDHNSKFKNSEMLLVLKVGNGLLFNFTLKFTRK